MKINDKKVQDNSPTNSFLDFMCQYQNENKTATKSLGYNNFQIKKIRALYGRRGTLDVKQIQAKMAEKQRLEDEKKLGLHECDGFHEVDEKENVEKQMKAEEDEMKNAEDAMPTDGSPFI